MLAAESEVERLKQDIVELREVASALRNYIDSIPKEIDFTIAMPGVDRDWVDAVIDDYEAYVAEQRQTAN